MLSSIDGGKTPFATLTNPFPSGILAPSGSAKGLGTALGQNISYNIRDRQIPEYHQYSVGVQRELPWRSVVDVSYVGSRTNKASWDKRLSHGFHMLASYTFSKSTEATSVLNMGDGVFQELTPTHRPHNLRLSGGWNAP